ncbi:MAG: SPOR domain-containing protein [Alphaproteobacteria bacterium]|nr:SPOR domain-containing protein [Alphaproteobacteria bacterium]
MRRAVLLGVSFLLAGCPSLDDLRFWNREAPDERAAPAANVETASTVENARKNLSEDNKPKSVGLHLGDRFTFDNPPMTWEIVKISKDRVEWRGDDDEVHVTGVNPILPALEWSGPKGGKGRRLIRDKVGSLFPMRVGAKTTFRSTVTSDRPPFGWENIWTCTVQGKEFVPWRGRSVETYVVGCGRKRTNELTFNYAPEIGHYITQRTFQGAGKPELLRRLISVDYARERCVKVAVKKPETKTTIKKTPPTRKKAAKKTTLGVPKKPLKSGVAASRPFAKKALPAQTPARVPNASGDLKQLLDSVIVKTPNFAEDATEAGATKVFVPRPRIVKAPPKKVAGISAIKAKTKRTSPLKVPPRKSVPAPVAVAGKPPVPKPAITAKSTRGVIAPPPPKLMANLQIKKFGPRVSSAPASKGFGVHLASYRSAKTAIRGWGILKSQARGALDSYKAKLRKIHIEGKGDFYRLYAGEPMVKADAKRLCGALKTRKLACNVKALASR